MIKKIAYVLGAGFSRPWGLPLMDDFISKSKELFADNKSKYDHFTHFYELVNDYSKIKHYLNFDLQNIENLLSLMEMNEKIDNDSITNIVKSFIVDVIKGYTKEFQVDRANLPSNWEDLFLGTNEEREYLNFITNILMLQFERIGPIYSGIYLNASRNKQSRNAYAIVTLNYDLILENGLNHIKRQYNCSDIPVFEKEIYDSEWKNVNLAKIHGCIEKDIIIAPTWNKTKNETIIQEWKLAKQILSDANIIRIVGYSLPDSDTYIKYLLGVAINENSHLDKIEAICIDTDGSIENRYSSFFSKRNFRFVNSSFFDTFLRNKRNILGTFKNNLVVMDGLN